MSLYKALLNKHIAAEYNGTGPLQTSVQLNLHIKHRIGVLHLTNVH